MNRTAMTRRLDRIEKKLDTISGTATCRECGHGLEGGLEALFPDSKPWSFARLTPEQADRLEAIEGSIKSETRPCPRCRRRGQVEILEGVDQELLAERLDLWAIGCGVEPLGGYHKREDMTENERV